MSPDGKLPQISGNSVDYVWSYDTFVHFPRELFDTYVKTGRGFAFALCNRLSLNWNDECFQYRDFDEV